MFHPRNHPIQNLQSLKLQNVTHETRSSPTTRRRHCGHVARNTWRGWQSWSWHPTNEQSDIFILRWKIVSEGRTRHVRDPGKYCRAVAGKSMRGLWMIYVCDSTCWDCRFELIVEGFFFYLTRFCIMWILRVCYKSVFLIFFCSFSDVILVFYMSIYFPFILPVSSLLFQYFLRTSPYSCFLSIYYNIISLVIHIKYLFRFCVHITIIFNIYLIKYWIIIIDKFNFQIWYLIFKNRINSFESTST